MDATMQLHTMPTEVQGLDQILPGGLLKGGVYIIDGAPGTGKTILANQICFTHVASEGRALFTTLLAESHARMLQHLRSMSFFRESAMPHRLFYASLSSILASDGLDGVVAAIGSELRRHEPGILVIDGFSITRECATSHQHFKRIVQQIQSLAVAYECVVLLLTSEVDAATETAETMVDGIIRLQHHLVDRRTERTLQVIKFRGRDFLPGTHSFQITAQGLEIYPRIEARFGVPSARDDYAIARCSTAVKGLDELMHGGLLARTTNGIYGPTGIGKTTFGLQYMSAASATDPGLFFGFFESPERLRVKADAIGIDLRSIEQRGELEFIWRPLGERLLDQLGHEIIDAIRRRNAKRVFIDGYHGFVEAAVSPERLTRFISSLANEMRVLGATAVVSMESRNILGASMELPSKGLSSLLEGLVLMRYAEIRGRVRRLISMTKLRDSDFDPHLREFQITPMGIEIGAPIEGLEALLSGFGREPNQTIGGTAR
jgi:circadian clock protein KaiC